MKQAIFSFIGLATFSGGILSAQTQAHYAGVNVTNQLTLTSTMNLMQLSQNSPLPAGIGTAALTPEKQKAPYKRPTPPVTSGISSLKIASTPGLSVTPASSLGFNGLTHADQRLSSGGNQWSTEPATPGIAVGGNFIVEGVDDAIQVYSASGTPQLPLVVSANQFFNLPVAIDRTNDVCPGPYLTDMRVFFDPDIQRFIVTEWGQPQGLFSCANLASSTQWVAVSQTPDPTAGWNIYTMNTADSTSSGCPCVPDYPQIGADQYALFISSNEFDASTLTQFFRTNILVISKSDLGSGATNPSMVKFTLPNVNGFNFSVQPAVTPSGASYFTANGGLEYFVSSQSQFATGASLSVFAMTNTSSINTVTTLGVNMLLTQTTVNTGISYTYPGLANQLAGNYPYGQSLFDPEPFLSGGPDCRTLSVVYSGGRLYVSLPSEVTDGNGKNVVGGAYYILSPTYRGTTLSASIVRQGYLAVNSNHILRPVIAMNGQGKGAVVFTLVGPNYYPSAAWLPINPTTTGSVIQLAGSGAAPEDGFTAYEDANGNVLTFQFVGGVARWGDNSAAAVAADGSIWGATEYIPNLPRTSLANWGTYLMHINP